MHYYSHDDPMYWIRHKTYWIKIKQPVKVCMLEENPNL